MPEQGKEPLWNLPFMHQADFYAAAYYIADNQNQQKPSPQSMKLREPLPRHTATFLDRIALLFARYKLSKQPKTSANVTATALVEEPSESGRRAFKIYVAKNAGAELGPDGDEAFGDKLAGWLSNGCFSSSPDSESSQQIWSTLQEWWKDRTFYYANGIPQLWSKQLGGGKVKENVRAFIQRAGLNDNNFEADWSHTERILTIVQCVPDHVKRLQDELQHMNNDMNGTGGKQRRKAEQRKISVKNAITTELSKHFSDEKLHHECWEFRRRKNRQDYIEIKNVEIAADGERSHDHLLEQFKAANDFRKLVKYIELLGLLRAAWYTFRDFCDANDSPKIYVEFLARPDDYYLEKSLVKPVLDKWHALATTLPAGNLMAASLEKVSRDFQGDQRLKKLFHCEMQLLNKFNDPLLFSRCYSYFGCSKRSCIFCWYVLEAHSRFHTGGGHFKVSPNAAFPFAVSVATFPLIRAIRDWQARMLDLITDQAFGRETAWTENMTIDFTTGRGSTFNNPDKALNEAKSSISVEGTVVQNEKGPPGRKVRAIKIPEDGTEPFLDDIELCCVLEPDVDSLYPYIFSSDLESYDGSYFLYPKIFCQLSAETYSEDPFRAWVSKSFSRFTWRGPDEDQVKYAVYHRLDEKLDVNKWCVSKMENYDGSPYKTPSFCKDLWHGDIYIFKVEYEQEDPIQLLSYNDQDERFEECLDEFLDYLAYDWGVKIYESTQRLVWSRLEHTSMRMKILEKGNQTAPLLWGDFV